MARSLLKIRQSQWQWLGNWRDFCATVADSWGLEVAVAQMPAQRNLPNSAGSAETHSLKVTQINDRTAELVNLLVVLIAVVVHGPGTESIKRTVPGSLSNELINDFVYLFN